MVMDRNLHSVLTAPGHHPHASCSWGRRLECWLGIPRVLYERTLPYLFLLLVASLAFQTLLLSVHGLCASVSGFPCSYKTSAICLGPS